MGLAMLFKSANFEIVEMGQWGNFEYIQKMWYMFDWPSLDKLKNIRNEEKNVSQCWILVKNYTSCCIFHKKVLLFKNNNIHYR
jgi:hypothetical protein